MFASPESTPASAFAKHGRMLITIGWEGQQFVGYCLMEQTVTSLVTYKYSGL